MTTAPFRYKISILIAVALVAAGAAVTHAQRPQGGGPPGGGAVTVDFVAVGANGQIVPDLTAADVAIKISGKARKVSSLTLKKFDAAAGPVSSVPAPFATNTPVSGRSFLIVIDADSLDAGTERAIKENLEELFKALNPNDRVAFSIAPKDTAQIRFGASLATVRDEVSKFVGRRPASAKANTDQAKEENQCRSRDTLMLLRSLIDGLGGSDTPTSVVFIASGLSAETQAAAGATQQCQVSRDNYQALSSATANARATLFVVQGDTSVAGRDDGLENLVGVTGSGPVIRLTGGGFSRVLAESSTYYMASLEPDPADKGGTQRIEVKATREGVIVHHRAEVALGRSGARAGAAQKVSPRDMLRTPSPFTDLQLRATTFVSRGQADKMLILALAEPTDPSVKLTAMSAGLVDSSSKLIAQATVDEKQLATFPVAIPMAAAAGKYRLRIATTDAEGRSGAVDLDLDANLTSAGTLKLGTILMAGPRGQGYSPMMVFSDDEIGMQVELYGQITGQVTAKIEIAATTDGPAIITAEVGGQGTSEPDKFILSSKVPIAKLAPGDYVVRAVVQMEGQPEGKVYRTLRKIAK